MTDLYDLYERQQERPERIIEVPKFEEKIARWAEKQEWFRLDDNYFLLPNGSIVSISELEDIIVGE